MAKPFDVSKFRKGITKAIDGLSIGFNDPTDWISTGNYALNYRISGDFYKGIPLGKVTVFAGESGSGKSYICSGNLVRHAQEQGIYVVLVDSENALDESWLHALGVDTSEDKLLKLNMAMIDDVAKTISEFMKEYKVIPEGEKPKVLFVIDSLGMLLTPTDVNQFEAGDMKGDMGRKPKALTALVRNCVNMFGNHNVGLVATNHTYASQDMFDPDDKISGGQGFVYASSIVVAIKKLKLKEDEDGNKITEVRGIRAACKVMKTRYAKPFESVQVKIPYETGMNPYSGMLDMMESLELVKKEGNSLVYTGVNGAIIKKFRKAWEANTDGCLDTVMAEFEQKTANKLSTVVSEEATEEAPE
jgi:recombination protein RecA